MRERLHVSANRRAHHQYGFPLPPCSSFQLQFHKAKPDLMNARSKAEEHYPKREFYDVDTRLKRLKTFVTFPRAPFYGLEKQLDACLIAIIVIFSSRPPSRSTRKIPGRKIYAEIINSVYEVVNIFLSLSTSPRLAISDIEHHRGELRDGKFPSGSVGLISLFHVNGFLTMAN